VIKVIRETGQIPAGPFLTRDPQFHALRYTIVKCLFGADRKIVAQAKAWDLKFMAVSDLNGQTVLSRKRGVVDVKGPCGGLFWSEKPGAPFIVACFKGTTPTSMDSYCEGLTGPRLLGVYC
jgi:hypothetical protein